MKRLLSMLAIMAAVVLIPSCQKELPDSIKNVDVNQGGSGQNPTPTPTPTPTPELKVMEPGQFGAKGGQQTITITATGAWTLTKSSESDWLVVKTTSGKAGTTQVDLEAKENTSLSERTATITVESEVGNQIVKVIQSGAEPVLQLNKNDLSFTANAGSDSFAITSNTSWTITSDQDWCMVSSSSGSNNATVTVNVSENTSTSSRTATIIVRASDVLQSIEVSQSGVNSTTVVDPAPIQSNISISLTLTNAHGCPISLDGDVAFILGNPDYYGNYYGREEPYSITERMGFNTGGFTLAAGESRVVTIAGELGGRSPLDPSLLSYAQRRSNVLLYVVGNSEIVIADNMDPGIIFQNGETYNIVFR